jgi:hypothetical protein
MITSKDAFYAVQWRLCQNKPSKHLVVRVSVDENVLTTRWWLIASREELLATGRRELS